MKRETKTINAFTDAFIEKKLDPVKHFNEVYGGTSKKFSGLIGHSLVNTIKDKKSNQKIVLLRMFVGPTDGKKQPYIIAVNIYNRLVVVDLISSKKSAKTMADEHEKKIINKTFAYKTGKLTINSEKMINFSENNDVNSLAAYIISACGFASNGDASQGEALILKMM